jgi:RNA polymerase sigma-70 factor (ECF subfamily)
MEISEFISKAQNGNTEAFAGIYDLYAQRIFRYVKLKIQNQPEAEDLLQEIFLKAWKGLPSFNPQAGNFSAWLYRVASNTINDHFRKLYRKPRTIELTDLDDVATGESVVETLSRESEMTEIKTALKKLRPQYQEVVELRFIQDFTVEETARVMRRSRLSVRVTQTRALKRLRQHLRRLNKPTRI